MPTRAPCRTVEDDDDLTAVVDSMTPRTIECARAAALWDAEIGRDDDDPGLLLIVVRVPPPPPLPLFFDAEDDLWY